MRYADISVNSPIAQSKTFSYSIPEDLNLEVGQAVWVPFGDKTLQGIVLELTPYPAVPETREVAGIIDSIPLLTPHQIALARWISSYYLSPLFDAVALLLPPGFERRVITFFSLPSGEGALPSDLSSDQKTILEMVRQKGKVSQKELEKTAGVRRTQRALPQLVRQKLIVKSYILEKIRIKPKTVPHVRLKVGVEEAQRFLSGLSRRNEKQTEIIRFLIENPVPVGLPELKSRIDCSAATIRTLTGKGLIETQPVRMERDPLASQNINLSFPLPLTSSQSNVFRSICDSLHKQHFSSSKPDVFLLHGVTGSGKTEIYIQALEETLKRGKRGIVLVPEISMTPQIIERFISRFPGRVAILHSELSLGEQFDEWWRIKRGEFDVVIGPRSAIFAPQPDLGLIILDEEHEWTYKQDEYSPRYHTREVALKLAELTGAVVVLGSATPDVESYFRTLNSEFRLLELPERVTRGEGTPLPQVEIVDLRAELKAGNYSLFSRLLYSSIEFALQNREQIILFLNRRGAASFVECRNCGFVIRCKRCDVPLSYHFADGVLVCHQCNYHIQAPQVCPSCRSRKIKYLGVGTEALEQEVAKTFPQARLLRWDSDAIQGHSHAHQDIFAQFRAGGADILIGTQMIAKGLDLPGVTLVGVVSADITMNLPDFRAGERTYQLLSQVAGRAGRGSAGGKVIIQTYSPEHYAVQAAARHDYKSFYQKEMIYRIEMRNPPFSRLARLTFTHHDETRCREEAEKLKRQITSEKDIRGLAGVSLIGPAPAFIPRLRGRFRWQIMVRAADPSSLLSGIPLSRGWTVDIDPYGM